MTEKQPDCTAWLWSGGRHRAEPCRAPGRYEENGVRWCGRHLPSNLAKRKEQMQEKAASEKRRIKYLRTAKLVDFVRGHPDIPDIELAELLIERGLV